MAGGQERILRGRINSMQATKKITRAMELIAASRIVKAQQRVHAAVPYSDQITEVVRDLSAAGASTDAALLAGRDEIKTKCYVVIAADRGLCGGYNAGVQRAAEGEIKADVLAGKGYEIIPVGRRVESYFRFREYELGQEFGGFSDMPHYDDAKAIGDHVIELFLNGEVDSVELIYTRFISAGSQEVVMRPLVPLTEETVEGGDGKDALGQDYEYEPDPTTILETLLPRYVEARVYADLLNAAASEHAFRQRAMKAATDNADELIKNLSIIMNRARQDAITTEIMEIVGGAEALSGDAEDEVLYPGIDELDGLQEGPAGAGPGGGKRVKDARVEREQSLADAGTAAANGGAATATMIRDNEAVDSAAGDEFGVAAEQSATVASARADAVATDLDAADEAAAADGDGLTATSGTSDPNLNATADTAGIATTADSAAVEGAVTPADGPTAAPVTDDNPLGLRLADEGTAPDDLTKVKGIGKVLNNKLHGLGVTTYRQIAQWTPAEIARVNEHLDFPGRIEREEWIAQSKDLHRDHHGEEL